MQIIPHGGGSALGKTGSSEGRPPSDCGAPNGGMSASNNLGTPGGGVSALSNCDAPNELHVRSWQPGYSQRRCVRSQ